MRGQCSLSMRGAGRIVGASELQAPCLNWREPALGDWQLLTPLTQSWLSQATALASKIPEGVALAALLVPVVLAIFSGRVFVLLGCLLLTTISFCALVAPANIPVILAAGVYLGSVIIALSGIVARQ